MSAGAVDHGKSGSADQTWPQLYTEMSTADRAVPLGPADLERLAVAAHMVGMDGDCVEAWSRAYRLRADRGEIMRAARCAFWVSFELLNRGDFAAAGGWVARCGRLLDEFGQDCVEHAYLSLAKAFPLTVGGDVDAGLASFRRAAELGERFGDEDVLALARNGTGRSLIRLGRGTEGVAVLDEAMLSVVGGEVSPVVAGTVYCSVIEACQEVLDLRRAREWTASLRSWCDSQPGTVPYRGKCLVYRCDVLQRHGDWQEAMSEALRACELLATPTPQAALGMAHYQCGELLRLRGDVAAAGEQYRLASRYGKDPQPGLALLRLAQGEHAAARSTVTRALAEARFPGDRAALLAPAVEILLASRDSGAADEAARELGDIAADLDKPVLHGWARYAAGMVRLGTDDARLALHELRQAEGIWRELDMPYEAARTRAAIGTACRQVGDIDTAELELSAAADVFTRLGAASDLAGLHDELNPPDGLTARELEVIRLLATGMTNRAIADTLVISEKTVATHVGNIFTKLGVTSRAAATAYAYEHRLV